jgi:hypothetical protein
MYVQEPDANKGNRIANTKASHQNTKKERNNVRRCRATTTYSTVQCAHTRAYFKNRVDVDSWISSWSESVKPRNTSLEIAATFITPRPASELFRCSRGWIWVSSHRFGHGACFASQFWVHWAALAVVWATRRSFVALGRCGSESGIA